jgi:hypothetical protein
MGPGPMEWWAIDGGQRGLLLEGEGGRYLLISYVQRITVSYSSQSFPPLNEIATSRSLLISSS